MVTDVGLMVRDRTPTLIVSVTVPVGLEASATPAATVASAVTVSASTLNLRRPLAARAILFPT
jgi:hypothetical protein